jgi:hypothetical protein
VVGSVQDQILNRLAFLQLELGQRVLLPLLVGLPLLLGLCAGVLDQLLLFGLEVLLAVGVTRLPLAGHDVGELLNRAFSQRDPEEVVVPGEGDGGLVVGPAGIALGAARPGDLLAGARPGVNEHDVAALDEQDPSTGRIPDAPARHLLPLVVAELRGSPPSRPTA